jgi:rhomboid protease GluP
MQLLFARLSAEKAHTYGLVLTAVGIAYQAAHNGPLWSISVRSAQRRPAIEAISLYLQENPGQSPDSRALSKLGGRTYSAWYVAAMLLLIHLLIARGGDQAQFVAQLGADAGKIMSGQIYRCITAMLLHADINHLLGNLAGLVIFGGVTASLCGWGLGWLMVLAAGFAGNLATAFWYGQDHTAIGASTAVFAAVGICTILSIKIRRWNRSDAFSHSWRRWLPLAGGLALLGLLGTSPHADLAAHLCGFVFGLILGSLAGLRKGRLPFQVSRQVQWAAALAAVGLVAAGWLRGLYYNG